MNEVLEEIKNLYPTNIKVDLQSFLIYTSVFIITVILCAFFVEKCRIKRYVILCAMITALPLSILAGVRYGVGTDYFNYIEIIHAARSDSFSAVADKYILEPGFNLFIVTISRIFSNDGVIMFLMEYITLSAAFYAFARLNRKLNYTVAVSFYYIMFFNFSLNISRQMMAMSFVILGISYLLTKKRLRYLICCAVAFSLHYSAILGLAFGVVYFIFKKRKMRYGHYQMLNMIYMIVVLIAAFYIKEIMMTVFNIVPGLSKYARYLISSPNVTMFSFVKGILLAGPLLLVGRYINRDTDMVFLRNCVWLYFIVATGAYYFNYVSRMIMYERLVLIITVAMLLPRLKGGLKNLYGVYYMGLYVLFYYNSFIINNHADTFPLRFIWGT